MRIVVADDPVAGGVQVHHRDFAEIRARGRDAAEAAGRLALQLERALDSALTEWRRAGLEQALADARAAAVPPGSGGAG